MTAQSPRAKPSRKMRTAESGRVLVSAWKRSGLSQIAYSRQHQIGNHLLSYWRKRLGRAKIAPARGVDFIQVAKEKPSSASPPPQPLDIVLSCGSVVRVSPGVDPALLRLVVTTLAGDAC